MLESILQTKLLERKHIRSDRTKFRSTFSWKQAKILGEIKPKKPTWTTTCDAKIIAERLLKNPDVAGFSILIDQTFFGGDIANIELVRSATKPTLFKEFVFEESQIDGASYYRYDAVLLIAKMFPVNREVVAKTPPSKEGRSDKFTPSNEGWSASGGAEILWKLGVFESVNLIPNPSPKRGRELKELVNYCLSRNIEPLIEVDNPADLAEVLQNFSPDDITIGINCRDLDTMLIDREDHFRFWRSELMNYHVLALSGISDFAQVQEYQWKYDGVLIGSLFSQW